MSFEINFWVESELRETFKNFLGLLEASVLSTLSNGFLLPLS